MTLNNETIHIENLSIGYPGKGEVKVVADSICAGINSGELTCLLGANGVGKSTLLRTLSAFQPKLGGEIRIQGKEIEDYTDKQLSRVISVVLTEKCDIRNMSVTELIGLGRSPYTGFWGTLSKEDRGVVERSIALVGIPHLAHRMVHTLSDGERQKVMIAKALVQECPLILLDEPTAFLDVVSRIEIMTLLHNIARKQHKTILLSTHDIDQALIQADRLWLLSPGNGLCCGVTEDMVFNGELDRLFDHEKICFDRGRGGYFPVVQGYRKVVVKAEDPALWHWSVNVLNRFQYSGLPSDAADGNCPILTITSPNQMSWEEKGQVASFRSFEELTARLKRFSVDAFK